ncbi:hypothetical protein K503DRAFT_774280 [Rhizopogon vinicolor AM-OR11-026]|uniref:Pheromone n=1 Tax=Rhizopogon vinicolor AM-OR11-026 TaxID=1314800 RepID=A0A1B7MQ03_9AGAM|nr:hypothetical protein K503DRAFT_774280 [Rhizopogon vinicolor AM-OR11-026]
MDIFSSLSSISLDELDIAHTPSSSSSYSRLAHSDDDACPIPTEYEHSYSASSGWYCIIA